MARIKIVHSTEYTYTYRNPVGLLRHGLMVRPDDSHDLRLHSSELKIEPGPSAVCWKHDAFDNSICFVEWPEGVTTEGLSIVSKLDLTHHPDGPSLLQYSLEPDAEAFPFAYAGNEVPDLAHFVARQSPDPEQKVDAWARGIAADAGATETPSVLEAMTRAIQQEFQYVARHDVGTQTAVQTVELGVGTCRDFAVLITEALRSFGLATRFVAGYLYDDTSETTRGGGGTHAWCGVCVPGAGWVEYDPTNGLVAGANLIRVGVTREASQAIPISGGFVGSASDPIAMHVDVSVGAVPMP